MKAHNTLDELLADFDADSKRQIDEKVKEYEATHVVLFENQQLDSGQCGEQSAMPVGPNNTFKSVEDCKGKWLNDLPSQRQYPVAYAPVA